MVLVVDLEGEIAERVNNLVLADGQIAQGRLGATHLDEVGEGA